MSRDCGDLFDGRGFRELRERLTSECCDGVSRSEVEFMMAAQVHQGRITREA